MNERSPHFSSSSQLHQQQQQVSARLPTCPGGLKYVAAAAGCLQGRLTPQDCLLHRLYLCLDGWLAGCPWPVQVVSAELVQFSSNWVWYLRRNVTCLQKLSWKSKDHPESEWVNDGCLKAKATLLVTSRRRCWSGWQSKLIFCDGTYES